MTTRSDCWKYKWSYDKGCVDGEKLKSLLRNNGISTEYSIDDQYGYAAAIFSHGNIFYMSLSISFDGQDVTEQGKPFDEAGGWIHIGCNDGVLFLTFMEEFQKHCTYDVVIPFDWA